jgi:cell division protein FtsA
VEGDLAKKPSAIVGLDVGTTKICAVVGELTDNGISIIGTGEVPSTGLKKGVVINIEATVTSIQAAIEKAEQMAGVDIDSVYTGISGGHIKGFSSHGVIAIKNKTVSKSDVDRVIDAARAVALPTDREVIHIIPQEFIVDNHSAITEPIGMAGTRLEAKVHIVTAAVSSAQNIVNCVNSAGLHVSDIVLQQIASSEAVLSKEEKDLGVALIDIGGGTTDIAIYRMGSLVHTSVIALGGNNLTHDISVGLRTPPQFAEEIKKKHGCCIANMVDKKDTIEVPSVGGRRARVVAKSLLSEIIELRVEEIFQLAYQEIIKSGLEKTIAARCC